MEMTLFDLDATENGYVTFKAEKNGTPFYVEYRIGDIDIITDYERPDVDFGIAHDGGWFVADVKVCFDDIKYEIDDNDSDRAEFIKFISMSEAEFDNMMTSLENKAREAVKNEVQNNPDKYID